MPRTPELYFALLGTLKIGGIVGPLFEAFMEKAVKDRLENSEAKVIITTNDLVDRIPKDELPNLEHIVIVDENVSEEYIDFNKELEKADSEFEIEWLDREDGLIFTLHFRFNRTA